jgi:ATP-dependent 26S proteasome regulatory subunit
MKKKTNNIYLEMIFNPYVKKVSYVFILILFLIICLRSCNIQKIEVNNKQINKELLEKQKHYQDSIKVLNKKLEKLNVKKDGVVIDYKTKIQYITKYKIRLQTEYIDTGSLIIMYDSTLAICDSLNTINDNIINTQTFKMSVLDSINSTLAYKNYLADRSIKELNNTLKKQKIKSTGKTVGYTLLGTCVGFGVGFLSGSLK